MNLPKRRFRKLIVVGLIMFCTAVALLVELNEESWMKNTGFFEDFLKLRKATELIRKSNGTNLDMTSSDDSTPTSRERLVLSAANKLHISLDKEERDKLARINESQRRRNLSCAGTNAGWQERYLELHNDIIKGKAQPKYLVYRCEKGNSGGYGNRLFGIISLFYLAVLTDRAFLIDWEYPTPLRTYLQPRNIQWSLDLRNIEHLNSSYFWWSSSGVRKRQASGWFVSGNKEELEGWFKITDFTRFFDRPAVFITLIWNTIYFIKSNIWLRQKARQLGILSGRSLTDGELFGCAFEYLFKTSDIVERKIHLALQELHFERDEFVIGLHIRTWDEASFKTETFDNQTNEYVKCFIAHAEKMKRFLQNTRFVPSTFSWFLATDNMKLKRFVMEHYKKYKTLSLRPRHIAKIDKDDHDEILDVLVDHFMLSKCNFLVLTPGSTFGQTAAGVGMLKRKEFVYVQTCRLPAKGQSTPH